MAVLAAHLGNNNLNYLPTATCPEQHKIKFQIKFATISYHNIGLPPF